MGPKSTCGARGASSSFPCSETRGGALISAHRCIFLELFARRPVFQGQDEIHQLDVIFKTVGTPSPDSWPGLQDLPWYELVKPKVVIESQLRSSFSKCVPAPCFLMETRLMRRSRWLSPAGLDVAERLLSMDPAKRPTADEALQMAYFREDPLPEMPDVCVFSFFLSWFCDQD